MLTYTHRFRVRASPEQVAAFHHAADAIRALTPPPLQVQFNFLEPLGDGSRAEFTMWLGPLPIRWAAVHSDVRPPHGFTDRQVRGPFKAWMHRHTFLAVDAQTTEVLDEVQVELGGPVSWCMWLSLPGLFAYRAWATRRSMRPDV